MQIKITTETPTGVEFSTMEIPIKLIKALLTAIILPGRNVSTTDAKHYAQDIIDREGLK